MSPSDETELDDDGPYRVFGRGTERGADEPAPPPSAAPEGARLPAWAIAAHLSPLASFLLPGLALDLLAPLFIWQLIGRDDEFVSDQAKEAFNFQVNLAVVYVVLWISCVGTLLIPVLAAVRVVFAVLAAVKASEGRRYRYPWIRRIVS